MFSCSRFLLSSVVLSAAFVLHGEETLAHLQPTADTYLESDGASGGINTGYYVTPKTRIEADYRVCITNSGTRSAFGCLWKINDDTSGSFSLYSQKGYLKTGYWNGEANKYPTSTLIDGESNMRFQTVVDFKNGKITHSSNGISVESVKIDISKWSEESPSTVPMALFTTMGTDGKFTSSNRISMRLYALSVYEDDVLVRDYVPYGSETVTGLLERCSGKVAVPMVSTVPGSSDAMSHFKLGSDVGYMESSIDRKQVFDTGVCADSTTKIDIEFTMLSTNKNQNVFGAATVGGFFGLGVNAKGNFVWDFQDCESPMLRSMSFKADGGDYRFVADGPGGTVELYRGSSLKFKFDFTEKLTEQAQPIVFFNRANRDAEGAVTYDRPASVRIRSAKIWKGGVLQRNYEPRLVDNKAGLYDLENGTFSTARQLEADTTYELGFGGTLTGSSENGAGAQANLDAYLETDALGYIMTDYMINGTTRIDIDMALVKHSKNMRIIACDVHSLFLQNEALKWSLKVGEKSIYPAVTPESERWVASFDSPAGVASLATGGVVKKTETFTAGAVAEAQKPLLLFGNYKEGGSPQQKAAIRLYGLSIYENGSLVRKFLPCQVDGQAGLWEVCRGKFWQDDTDYGSFKFGGAGTNGCGMVFSEQPKSCTLKLDGEDTLVAFAPTAIAYQWYENGEPIAGATKSSLKVTWKRPRVNTYKCVAFYAQFGQAESNDAVVTGEPGGLKIIFR